MRIGDRFRRDFAAGTTLTDNVSVGEIVRTIAAENGLLSSISPELNNQMPGHLDQFYENDAEFLAKLARQYDAISKATGVTGSLWCRAQERAQVVRTYLR
ncbi:hypothetical protein D8682_08450 [Buttiauxella sp. 3AFRM03]|uniref:hypothetical protein n=1 Tax=Buttiauxella sp. 3AFRM03 TaxID=2479367 RepID=UPI000EF80DF5|nr:hypothetical protein [Buttiauxella sp. 3AFRM03]AYN27020.1 hypothetical protein D8682_08450 [Buttiauxella sp. 3AFRM03]